MNIQIMIHALLMLMMTVILFTAGMAAKKKKGDWLPKHRKLAFSGLICGLAGVLWIAGFKQAMGFHHFRSPHAIGGLVTIILAAITPVFGFLVSRGKKAPHMIFGRITVSLTGLTAASGLMRLLQFAGIIGSSK